MKTKNYNCYIHIPFCRSKCKYCRFASFSILDNLKIEKYVDFLCKEINLVTSSQLLVHSKQQSCINKNYIFTQIKRSWKLQVTSCKIRKNSNYWQLTTIYFWWWTPAILEERHLEKIFKSLKQNYKFSENIEITMETTPEEISLEKLNLWQKFSVNRLSIWLQTLNKKALKEIKRDEKGSILEKLEILKKFLEPPILTFPPKGKRNNISSSSGGMLNRGKLTPSNWHLTTISLDFIIWLPFVKFWETLENIKYILEKYDFVNHISVYMLEDYYNPSENKNEKFEQITYPKNWTLNSISEKEIWEEYILIKNFLEKKWFFRYELSNFAKVLEEKQSSSLICLLKGEGKYKKKIFDYSESSSEWQQSCYIDSQLTTVCKHNLWYWSHKETLAFGLWTSWFLNNTRYKNSDNFLDYYNFKGKELENLKKEDLFLEKIMFSIRTSGIPKELSKKLNKEKINYFIKNWFLEKNSEKITLADKWILYLDHILWEII